jgi:parallel beta-helix repeat protein
VAYNKIEGFAYDAIRGLADTSTYEYNIITTSYGIDNAHDDAFQSWSTDSAGKVGQGTVSNVVIRGNLIIDQTDPAQAFPQQYGMQGIGNFDGFSENWVIENNIIITDMWHGIALYGARNCRIMNNTVVKNPLNRTDKTPWIAIYPHKTRGAGEGNIVSNNLVSDLGEMTGVQQRSNNIVIRKKTYQDYFINYAGYDVHLRLGSKAINAGTGTGAPLIDRDEHSRALPVDAGAYEFTPARNNK